MKKVLLPLGSLSVFAILLYLKLFTFNPFSNYQDIQMIRKFAFVAIQYAQKNKVKLGDISPLYYEKLPLNEPERFFIESHGISFDSKQFGNERNDTIVTMSKGFDDLVIYNYSKNCWSSTQPILFLEKCQNR